MSFRYKSAMLSLVSMALVYGWYFGSAIAVGRHGLTSGNFIGLTATVALLTIVMIVGHILIALFSSDRKSGLDERERVFDLRATNVGYYALITGLFGALPFLGAWRSADALANAVVLLVVVAECARQAVFLIQYHRVA